MYKFMYKLTQAYVSLMYTYVSAYMNLYISLYKLM
jgi:hypothetical protein